MGVSGLAHPGSPAKRWSARIFHPPPRGPAIMKWRNDAIPRERGSRRAPERYAPATFFLPADAPGRGGGVADRPSPRSSPLPRAPRRALRTRAGTFNRTSRVQNAPLECRMHISTSTGPTRPRGRRPTRGACPRPRPPVHDSRREGADIRHSRRADEDVHREHPAGRRAHDRGARHVLHLHRRRGPGGPRAYSSSKAPV